LAKKIEGFSLLQLIKKTNIFVFLNKGSVSCISTKRRMALLLHHSN
jgi:hypothetical protein